MANQFTKFEDSSFSHSGDILGRTENLNGSCDITTPLSGRFIVSWKGQAMMKLCTKFEISTFIHHEDKKCDKNTEIGVVCGLGVTEGHRQHSHSIEHI